MNTFKYTLLFTFLLSYWNLISQVFTPTSENVIPVEEFKHYCDNELNSELPKGTYFSDINGLLNPYVGSWEYESSQFKYQIELTKTTSNYFGIMVDILVLKYRILDENNNEIENTLTFNNDHKLVVKGDYLSDDGTYYIMSYIGSDVKCREVGTVFIEVRNENDLYLFLVPNNTLIKSDCPIVTFNLPVDRIMLSRKQ